MRTVALGSCEMVSAPGIMAWAINGYAFKRDRKAMINVMKSGWPDAGLTDKEWGKVLSREIPYRIEDGKVVIELERA